MDSESPGEAREATDGTSSHYRSIIEAVRDGIFVLDLDGTITYVNDSLCALTGHERDELLDATFDTLVESELVEPDAYERFETSIDKLGAGDIQQQTLTFEISGERERVVDVHVSRHLREDGTEDIVGVVRDVTEREGRVQAAEQKQKVLAQLYEIGADASLTFEEKTQRILAIGCEYLDLPYGFLTRIEADVQQIVHTVGDHVLLQPGESAPLEESYCRKTIESEELVGMQDARAQLGDDDPAYELFELGCYIGTKVLIGDQLYGTFCFAAPHERDREFTSGEREVIKLLGQWAGYELERQRFEERLQALHRISQQLLGAETTEEVAAISLEMGENLFDLSVMAYWEYDAASDVLRPLAATDEAEHIFGTNPTIERGDALVWESFDSGDIRSYGDVTDRPAVADPETELRSEVQVPCGNHGVITSSATEPDAFDEIDVESLRLLGALVTEAITAVKREERLVERGEALQRQNDRLDEFAKVVAHDLRNPLAGAIGALEIVRDTPEEQFFDMLDRSLERMNDLVDELLEIARGERQAVTPRPLSLQSTVEEAWSYTDAPDATLSTDDQLGEVRADETRLFQLFGNLFRNSVEHGGDDVTVEVGLLAQDEGFYVADDGPGLPEKTRTAIQNIDEPDRVAETGIGFMSITDVVAEHDWDLSVCNPDDGTRFEIRTGEQAE
jgi:PAS domain S-box-containing protein